MSSFSTSVGRGFPRGCRAARSVASALAARRFKGGAAERRIERLVIGGVKFELIQTFIKPRGPFRASAVRVGSCPRELALRSSRRPRRAWSGGSMACGFSEHGFSVNDVVGWHGGAMAHRRLHFQRPSRPDRPKFDQGPYNQAPGARTLSASSPICLPSIRTSWPTDRALNRAMANEPECGQGDDRPHDVHPPPQQARSSARTRDPPGRLSLARSPYEDSPTTSSSAARRRVTDDDIPRHRRGTAGRSTKLDALSKPWKLRAAREMTNRPCHVGSERRRARAGARREQVIDLTLAISFYNAVVRLLGTLQIDVEPSTKRILWKNIAAALGLRGRKGFTIGGNSWRQR